MWSRGKAAVLVTLIVVIGGTCLTSCTFGPMSYTSVQDKQIGANVSVSGSQVPTSIHAEAAKTTAGWTPFAKLQPLTPVIDVTPSGALPAPMTLRMRLNRQAGPDDLVVIATSEQLNGSWIQLKATISPDGWYASAQVTHLSFLTTMFFSLKQLVATFKTNFLDNGVTGDLFTEATPPACANATQVSQDGYLLAASAKDTVYKCLGVENGTRVLKVVSRVRYPLEISTSNLAIQHWAGPQFGRLNSLGTENILYPFDEVDYAVSDLDPGQRAILATEYSGVAQSLYALQVGVTTLLSLVDFFGEGAGIALKGGRLSKTAFDTVGEKAADFVQVATCASALSKHNAGAVISGCFSPAQILDAFGWKGLLLAPLMAISDVVTFFRSSIEAVAGLLGGQDKYGIIISRASPSLASFIGKWYVHGSALTINADGTGVFWSNAGPCFDSFSDPNSPMCAVNEDLVFTGNADGTITGKITKVWYTEWDGSPTPPGYDPGSVGVPRIGDMFKLRLVHPNLLIETWLNRPDYGEGGNPYWCGSDYHGEECGA